MRFTKPIKYLLVAAVTLSAIVVGARACIEYSLRNMQFDLSGLADLTDKVSATVELATLTIPRCPFPPDYRSIGDQRREAMMLYVATIVDLYKTTFGKPPDSIDDLDKLPSFNNADKLNGRQVKKNCSIHVQPAGSYVLACGASLPPAKEIDVFLGKAGHVQRFYVLGGTEILYVSGAGCGVALSR
jgi:hypothetical protein